MCALGAAGEAAPAAARRLRAAAKRWATPVAALWAGPVLRVAGRASTGETRRPLSGKTLVRARGNREEVATNTNPRDGKLGAT